MSCCQAARPVSRDLYEHDEGIDGIVSSTMKIKVVAPIRYGLEDHSCLPSPMSFFHSCLMNVSLQFEGALFPTVSFQLSLLQKKGLFVVCGVAMCFSVGVAAPRAARFAGFGVKLLTVQLFGPSHQNAKNAKRKRDRDREREKERKREREKERKREREKERKREREKERKREREKERKREREQQQERRR